MLTERQTKEVEAIFARYRSSRLHPSDAYQAMAEIARALDLSWEPTLSEELRKMGVENLDGLVSDANNAMTMRVNNRGLEHQVRHLKDVCGMSEEDIRRWTGRWR